MYISDKDALTFASRLILILVPLLSSLFDTWSWIAEILLLFAVFIHSRSSGIRFTVLLLAAGYAAAMLSAGEGGFWQIGYAPWAGILLVVLKHRGLATSHSIFWSLMLAALLSALPVIPALSQLLNPENLQQSIASTLQLYEQQGTLSALGKQGITSAEVEKYLNIALPIYYKLMPAIAGILGMFVLGIAYLTYRQSMKKVQKLKPFAIWQMPWYAVWFTIAGLAAYLGGDYLDIEMLVIIGMNLMVLMSVISLVMGFSCLSFLFKHPKIPRMLILTIIFTGIFFPYLILMGSLVVGLFDLVLNFRRIPEKIEGGQL